MRIIKLHLRWMKLRWRLRQFARGTALALGKGKVVLFIEERLKARFGVHLMLIWCHVLGSYVELFGNAWCPIYFVFIQRERISLSVIPLCFEVPLWQVLLVNKWHASSTVNRALLWSFSHQGLFLYFLPKFFLFFVLFFLTEHIIHNLRIHLQFWPCVLKDWLFLDLFLSLLLLFCGDLLYLLGQIKLIVQTLKSRYVTLSYYSWFLFLNFRFGGILSGVFEWT